LRINNRPNTDIFSGRDVSSIWVKQTLKPGESASIPFVMTWYIPVRITENSMAFGNKEALNLAIKNYYATSYSSSSEVTDYVYTEYDYLYNTTARYRNI
jgi:uncharacterized protein (DUF608 family)